MKNIKKNIEESCTLPSIFYSSESIFNKAIDKLDEKNKEDFKIFVREKNIFNPHIMFIAKPAIINQWFEHLFNWLDKCEGEFDLEKLGGYDSGRLFAYLSERYLSYWFKKYCKCTEKNWVQLDNF